MPWKWQFPRQEAKYLNILAVGNHASVSDATQKEGERDLAPVLFEPHQTSSHASNLHKGEQLYIFFFSGGVSLEYLSFDCPESTSTISLLLEPADFIWSSCSVLFCKFREQP